MTQPCRQDRDSLFLLADLRLGDGADIQRIKVRNLSPGGMMAESQLRTVCGERLSVELRNLGWIDGTVAWVADNRFGVIFDRAIDCKAVRRPVTVANGLPPAYVPRPPVAASGPAPAEPGILRRIC